MKITLNVGPNKEHKLEYSRNWFWGTEKFCVNGEIIKKRHVLSPSNFISFPLCRRYEVTVSEPVATNIVFEKERPLLFAGFRPHKYRVLVNGELVHEQCGY